MEMPEHSNATTERHDAIKAKLRRLPGGPGVYLMKDRFGSVLYVGKAKCLKRRVSSYFQPSRRQAIEQPKIAAMVTLVCDIETIEVTNESEALLLEGRLIKQYKPRYNTDFVDNKQFLLVRVTMNEALPRFRLTRNRKEDGSHYFGPYAQSGLLRKTLSEMRLRFGILLGEGRPVRLEDGRWVLYDDAGAEIYKQTRPVSEVEYRQRVDEACAFLEGKTSEWIDDLEKKMAAAAERMEFERAADLRDIVRAMRKTVEPVRRFSGRGDPVRFLQKNRSTEEALSSLREALGLRDEPTSMECFDISHISGTHVVASMVRFNDGRPDRGQYRRFRIKSFVGNDDFRAMREVVERRYRRLSNEGKELPGLVVIDGGLGQVNAAMSAFADCGITPPPIIGLAKKDETIVFADGREPLNLPHHHPALQLLQRLRDEAHRFANSFSDELRRKTIRESILMDIPNLGEKRRQALMEHFGTIGRLREATAEEIAEVEGFGMKTAQKVAEFLRPGRR